ncbi:flavodoxin domain-containing protein [Halonatronum saccharophilum]|uniref:flavodoxin domain-containing protein n=1 Tax=Halonatronum saccharophilum TaxID=150060 RepID=UPI00048073A7
MEAIEVKENIYWVGAIDWDLRDFHGYLTQRGSTYNAYLIIDEKVTLVDTVKSHLYDEMIDRISSIIDPSKIDYIISNHVEMDHSGGLPKLMEVAENAEVVTSPKGKAGLLAHYGENWNFKVAKPGEKLNIGSRDIEFILTPMVHWPDNMVAYLREDKLLFSNDSLGQHYASSERFDDQASFDIIMEEAQKYYANIVMPYGSQVQRVLESLKDLDIEIIAPSHGVIWRTFVPEIIEKYKKWSVNKTEEKALIIYDTMWDSTKKMAYAIGDAFEEKGLNIRMLSLKNNHISDIITEVLTAKYICVGSPTLNNNMLPTVASFLTYLKGLAPKDRIGLAFGSYGWGGQSIGQVEEELKNCKFDILDSIKVNYIPDEEKLAEIKDNLKKSIM